MSAARALPVAVLLALASCASEPAVVSRQPARTTSATAAKPSYGETYVVARGDTLYSIAFRNQLDYHELAGWNGIGRDYGIRVGQRLRLTSPRALPLPSPDSGNIAAVTAKPPRAAAPAAVAAAPAAKPAVATQPTAAAPINDGLGARFESARWEWPTRGRVARGFDAEANKGLDISGDAGQIIVASGAGKVVYSGSALKGYGELVIIKHDEQYLSAYGYNRRRLVQEGETVAAGQPIAELGFGPSRRPILHFEIRDRGRPVDPAPLLPKR